MFTGATNAAMTSLVDNKMLLIKVKFPMNIFILSRVYTSLVNFLYSLVAYVIMLVVFRVTPCWTMLFSPVIVLFLLLFSLGIAYILATAYVFFGDVKHLYSVLLTLWMYMSALFFPVDQLNGIVRLVIQVNPVFNYIDCMRTIVMRGKMPEATQVIYIMAWGTAMYVVGYLVFARHRNDIMKKL
jgi:ABC-type polysaccharide/polyol phosphate export permease